MHTEPIHARSILTAAHRQPAHNAPDAALAWRRNHLLAAFTAVDRDRLLTEQLQLVSVRAGDVLHEAHRSGGGPLHHVFFPVTAVVSMVCMAADGAANEVAVVGPEGMVGAAQLLGDATTFTRAVVHAGGEALRIDSASMQRAFEHGSSVRDVVLRYVQGLMRQIAQTATCNRHHPIDRQLAKRLLMAIDRQGSNELVMTQESIAGLLGVRREGVTAAALKLQRAGIVRYSRGKITVLDRPGLEQQSCECYSVARKEFDLLRPGASAD